MAQLCSQCWLAHYYFCRVSCFVVAAFWWDSRLWLASASTCRVLLTVTHKHTHSLQPHVLNWPEFSFRRDIQGWHWGRMQQLHTERWSWQFGTNQWLLNCSFTQRRSVAKSVLCFQRHLWVCQHGNFQTSKHRMIKLGGRCIVQKYRPSSKLGVMAPRVHTPKNVASGYDVGKISTGCLVH